MDIAVNLVENYLRLTGYLTLSEFDVQRRTETGYQAITDVDIVAMRFPGDLYAGDPHDGDDCELLLIHDPALLLEPDMVDVIIGEVKQGEARINSGLKDHRVLHSVLRRLEWIYEGPVLDVVVALQQDGVALSEARGGGRVRTRLVAFGRAPEPSLNVMTHTHMVTAMLGFFSGTDDAFRPVQFRDPAPALLSLLLKTGFVIER